MAVPSAPILVHARNTGNGAVRLVWKPGSGGGTPVTYEVFRGVAENDTGVLGATETVALTVDATGGTFTVTFGGQTTSGVAANATAATLLAACLAAWATSTPTVAATDLAIVRTGSVNAYVYTFTWGGVFAFENVGAITASGASLTGGAGTAVPVTTPGVDPLVAELAAAGYAAGDLPWFDTTGAVATDYWFAVRAVNADGKSDASNQKHVLRTDTGANIDALGQGVEEVIPIGPGGGAALVTTSAGTTIKAGALVASVSATPTLDTSAYASGDSLHTTVLTFANAVGAALSGVIEKMVIVDAAVQSQPLELWLFNATVTPAAANAAHSISDADAAKCIGVIYSGPYYASALNSVSVAKGVNLPIKCAATSLFGILVTRGTPTYAASSLTVSLQIAQD